MRIKEKIDEINALINELDEIIPANVKGYKNDNKTKAACERYFERVVEAVIDLAFLTIKDNKYKIPEEDKQAFDTLVEMNVISKDLGERLKEAKGMRNILAHEYGKVDDELIFESITKEIKNDVNEFLNSVKELLD
ncbi:MAG: DUF86 domain-containing protein [Candidatus Woesearchaeota archaeon]